MFAHTDFETNGRAWFRNAVPPADLERLAKSFPADGRAGDRPATDSEAAHYFAGPNPVSDIAAVLGLAPAPVRLAVFDKSPQTNWAVPWHQDRVIAVTGRHDMPGYRNWLPKDGYWHVEPPPEILQDMVFVRVHLDAADETNGCLQLALGSHRSGVVSSSDASSLANSLPIENCIAAPGDVLVVKALTLHRSASSAAASRRRAIRIDYVDRLALPPPLQWALPA
ncbi:MAG: phytanoyl-CoA dioxygenase family protein [Rhodobacterales bacterium]|nr:phytanoyl-CoA dioxygenase family protein [Rhodobacterales bacterium]